VRNHEPKLERRAPLSMAVFESEDAAKAASEQIPSGMPETVELQDFELREVVASA
jgi:hypothetical protein